MKKTLKVILIVLLVLGACAAAAYAVTHYEPYNLRSIQKDPAAQLQKSIQRTKEAVVAGLAFRIPDSMTNAGKTGAIGLEWNSPEGNLAVTAYPRENSFTLTGTETISSGTENAFGFWVSEEAIVANLPAMTSGKAYGINPQTLENDLKNSPLLDVLGISYQDAMTFVDAMLAPTEEASENTDWLAMLDAKRQLKDLLRSSAVSVTEGVLPMDTIKFDVYRVSYTLSPEQMCSAIDIAGQFLLNTESYKSATGKNPEATDEIKTAIQEAKKAIRDNNATAIIDFYLHGKSQVIARMDCRIDWLQDKKSASINASLTLGEDPTLSGKYAFYLTTNLPDTPKRETKVIYHRSHAHNLPSRTLTVSTSDETITVLDLQINSITGVFSVELFDRDVCFTGTCSKTDNNVRLSTNLEDLGEIHLVFQGVAEAPEVPRYMNLCWLSRSELENLLEKFAANEPYIPDETWRIANISITSSNGSMSFYYLSHDCETLGDLLVENELAALDENGRIAYFYDGSVGNGWEIYIQGERYEGNLYDAVIGIETEIAIIAASVS